MHIAHTVSVSPAQKPSDPKLMRISDYVADCRRKGMGGGVLSHRAELTAASERLTLNGVSLIKATTADLRKDIASLQITKENKRYQPTRRIRAFEGFYAYLARKGYRTDNPMDPITAERKK